jgi:hypothetical protein
MSDIEREETKRHTNAEAVRTLEEINFSFDAYTNE